MPNARCLQLRWLNNRFETGAESAAQPERKPFVRGSYAYRPYGCFSLPVARRLCCDSSSSLTLTTNSANGRLERIPATMLKPEGTEPFPAVVIMHDCSGLGPRSSGCARFRWSRELVESGYVIVIPVEVLPRAAMPAAFGLTRHRVETTWLPLGAHPMHMRRWPTF